MNANLTFSKTHIVCTCLVMALLICGCSKPAPEATKDASPAKAVPQSSSSSPSKPSVEVAETDVASAAVKILNTAHRNGSVILLGECGPSGMSDPYALHPPVKLEPMNEALQEISTKYQNIYWRESRESGVRVVDSGAKAKLLKVRVREFRIVEDREPDAALAALWRAPEVAAFLRQNHVHLPRKMSTTKKVISPPMIIEMRNAMVADILDHIAAGYRMDPPKIWVYSECMDKTDKKNMVIDVQVK
jgi:hypothetical protein